MNNPKESFNNSFTFHRCGDINIFINTSEKTIPACFLKENDLCVCKFKSLKKRVEISTFQLKSTKNISSNVKNSHIKDMSILAKKIKRPSGSIRINENNELLEVKE